MDDSNQSDVQSHVAVENMAEFVSNHALQFIATEVFDTSTGHADNSIFRLVASSERVDALFVIHHEYRWHREARSKCHFFDDI